jgi:hypothetical protein
VGRRTGAAVRHGHGRAGDPQLRGATPRGRGCAGRLASVAKTVTRTGIAPALPKPPRWDRRGGEGRRARAVSHVKICEAATPDLMKVLSRRVWVGSARCYATRTFPHDKRRARRALRNSCEAVSISTGSICRRCRFCRPRRVRRRRRREAPATRHDHKRC